MLRSFPGADRPFFLQLQLLDPALEEQLRLSPKISFWSRAKNLLKLCIVGMLLKMLCFTIPVVGRFVLGITWFLNLSKVIGRKTAMCLAFLTLLPSVASYALVVQDVVIASYSVASQLLEPFFLRIHRKEDRNLFRTGLNRPYLLGFGFVFAVIFYIPLVGVCFWAYAQAAAANLMVILLASTKNKGDHQDYF